MLGEWGFEVTFKLAEFQEDQYNKLCKEIENVARSINKRLSEERKAKKEKK